MLNIALEGGIPIDSMQDYRAFQLLDAGSHSNGFDQHAMRRRNEYR
jgi:hypothetical protein